MSNARLLRLPEVLSITGLKKSTFYKLIGQGEISQGVNISERCKAWTSEEINNWIDSKIKEAA
jgi:prophage regulatory protein